MGALQQMLLGGGSAASFVGPLDSYTTSLWSACSIARLFTAFSTRAVTERNSSGGALFDIGFTAPGAFDSAAAVAAVTPNNGTLSEFTTQIGTNSHSWGQGTAANQPSIVTAGSFLGNVQFDASNDAMASGTTSNTTSGITVFLRGKLRSTATTQILLELSTNYNSNNAFVVYFDSGALSVGVHNGSGSAGYAVSNFSGSAPNDNVHCYRADSSAVTGAAMAVLFINGTKQTRSSNGDTGTLPTGMTFAANNWYLAARAATSFPSSLNVHTLLIYEGALSDADCTAISNIITALP